MYSIPFSSHVYMTKVHTYAMHHDRWKFIHIHVK